MHQITTGFHTNPQENQTMSNILHLNPAINPAYANRQSRRRKPVFARLPLAPINTSPVPGLTSLYHEDKAGDYGDPGWYKHPPGTVAFEWTSAMAEPARFKAEGTGSMPPLARPAEGVEVKARKPGSHSGH